MKRLFIAITPVFSDRVIREFYTIKSLFKNSKIKWVDFNDFHITLKFLGNIEEPLISEISNSLSRISERFSSFDISFRGFGIFGNIKSPRVLWAGIEKNIVLVSLRQSIEIELEQIGISMDSREFNPHLTLGRIKFIAEKKKFITLITNRAKENIANIKVDKFQLIESKLHRYGPVYNVLSEYYFSEKNKIKRPEKSLENYRMTPAKNSS